MNMKKRINELKTLKVDLKNLVAINDNNQFFGNITEMDIKFKVGEPLIANVKFLKFGYTDKLPHRGHSMYPFFDEKIEPIYFTEYFNLILVDNLERPKENEYEYYNGKDFSIEPLDEFSINIMSEPVDDDMEE